MNTPQWDRFWRYDRLSSFGTGVAGANYAGETAATWRSFFADLPDGARIVDLCTGNGAIAVLAVELAREVGKSFTVCGVDAADIRPLNFVTTRPGVIDAIEFRGRVPVEHLPFGDGSFDAVVSQFGIEYSDMDLSLAEAMRVTSDTGRLRLAMHAAEGAVVRDTRQSIADADYLLDQEGLIDLAAAGLRSLSGWDENRTSRSEAMGNLAKFKAALKAVEEYERTAMDRPMLASVRGNLIDAFNSYRRRPLSDQLASLEELATQVRDHRDRQRALLGASVSLGQVDDFCSQLKGGGFAHISTLEQRRDDELLGHVIEARRG
jgi:SAM-dependent methyltransferase